MLKTNAREARENIRKYIIDRFDCSNYVPKQKPETFPEIAAFIMDCFRSEKYSIREDYQYYRNNERAAFLDWCAGLPSVLDTCYYYNRSAVDDLAAILEETDSEKERYTETQAEELLTRLLYEELTKGERR